MTDLLSNTKKLQHRLSEKKSKSQVQQMIRGSKTKDTARLLSLQGKGAGAWIDCIPSSQRFALSPGLYRLATFGAGITSALTRFSYKVRVWKAPRPRGRPGYHLITCKSGGGPVWTHNSIVSTWSECLSQVHLCHTIEPRDTYCNSQSRPDIAIQNVFDFNVELDISIAHPWSRDILPSAAHGDKRGSSTEEGGEKEGEIQHRNPPWWLQPQADTIIVLEHFGFGGQEGQRFLHEISQRSRDEDGKANSIEFKTYWRRLFSMTLQRC